MPDINMGPVILLLKKRRDECYSVALDCRAASASAMREADKSRADADRFAAEYEACSRAIVLLTIEPASE